MRTYEETVENILKKKEKYDEKVKNRRKILTVVSAVAVFAIIFTAVPLSLSMISKKSNDPVEPPAASTDAEAAEMTDAQTERITDNVTEPPFVEETGSDTGDPDSVKPTLDYFSSVRLNYDEPDDDNGLFILSGSDMKGDIVIGSPVSDTVKRNVTGDFISRHKKPENFTVKVEADGDIELVSEPSVSISETESNDKNSAKDTVDVEFSYRYKEGGSKGHVYITFEYDLVNYYQDGSSRSEHKTFKSTGIAAKIKGYDFFTFGNKAAERKLYIDAAKYFGDTKTVSFNSNGGAYEYEIPSFCHDPYDPDYYGSPTAKELRMLFEAKPSDMTLKEAGVPDAKTVYVGGTVGASEGSYLAKTPGALADKQVIVYDENNDIIAVTLTNENGEFFIALNICEQDDGFVTLQVVIEEGHDFINDQTGYVYTIWSDNVRGGTAVDMGFCDRATAKTPDFVKYDRGEDFGSGVMTLKRMGYGDLYTDISGKTDDGTLYTAFNIFCSVFPSQLPGEKLRAEIRAEGDIKPISDTSCEYVEGEGTDSDVTFLLPDGGSGTLLIYCYEQKDDGAEILYGVKVLHLISADGALHRYDAFIYGSGDYSVNQSIAYRIEKAKESAGADFAAQTIGKYAG